MSAFNELTRAALREHRDHERELLDQIQREAMNLEHYPEGQEPRDSTVVDGHEVPVPKRLRGTLTVRW